MISRRSFLRGLSAVGASLLLPLKWVKAEPKPKVAQPAFYSPVAKPQNWEVAPKLRPPGCICPLCGTEDIDIKDGVAKCGNSVCGAEFSFQVQIYVDGWRKEPTIKMQQKVNDGRWETIQTL